jgi:hypothetical protein
VGDSELVELDVTGHYAVPVSRSRIGWLKARIGEKSGTLADDEAHHPGVRTAT